MANIVDIAAQFREALIRQDGAALAEMARRWLAVETLMLADTERLIEQVQAMKAEGATAEQIRWRLARLDIYQQLLAQIGQQLAVYNRRAAGDIEAESEQARELAREHAAGYVQAVSNGRVTLSTANLPVGAVENIAAIARGNQPLYNLLSNAYPAAVQGITNELLYGTAVGRNPRETARAIVRKGLAPGLNHILLVARDQQIRNYREMTRTLYDRSEAVTGYARLAAKNKRTCLACLALDGTVYETNELMALHPQDRCSLVPIVAGFPRPQFQSGEDWFRRQPPAVQREMMGPRRYQAWQDGRFRFGQLATVTENETWGPNAQVTAVSDLLAGRGGVERERV
ncbi:MAG: hypothetical protein H6661_10135 [Ardenticatenaceae bacterium]|nr:hypothetical protein [Ardenticatenaceae bacterium]